MTNNFGLTYVFTLFFSAPVHVRAAAILAPPQILSLAEPCNDNSP